MEKCEVNEEAEIPKKQYTVKMWDVTLKCGVTASFTIREDRGESHVVENDTWLAWTWPAEKRIARIRQSEVAGMNYQEIEQQEIPVYVPKGKSAKDTERATTRHRNISAIFDPDAGSAAL